MTEQRELRPLKRSIPPDLQERVEDIKIKVSRTADIGPPDELDERKRRWLIVGICLHTIISPVLRTYVVPVVTKLCYSLTSRNNIHKQTDLSYLKRYAPTNTILNYQAINSNKTKRNKAQYDYRVRSVVDFSRLFLQTHMAHFTAFDDSCDSSALLGIIVNIDRFPKDVQYDAEQIRSTIRNPWAHCDFSEWDAVKYADSFQLMGKLVKHLCLSSREENRILGELNRWATNGHCFLKGTVLGLEMVDEIRQQTHVLSEYMQTLCTEADNHFIKVQKELRGFENDLLEGIRKLENRTEKHDEEIDKFSLLATSVSIEMENLKAEVKRQEEDHIPKNIREQHNKLIMEWEDDAATFF
ncbi:unnamed protein product [Mytilus edulis]|uniref:Uncharacterized protein n=1 Tax=Mytilus edulis TaxID=6550 RepID=A0A8S3T213_MYTED|nr:unnamed protein product [Mytilus edulis]